MGGCIAREDTSAAGKACATAFNELDECEFAACVPYCIITGPTDTAGLDALLGTSTSNPGCMGNADTSVCTTYYNALQTKCTGTAITAYNSCVTLMNNGTTAAGLSAYLAELCGG